MSYQSKYFSRRTNPVTPDKSRGCFKIEYDTERERASIPNLICSYTRYQVCVRVRKFTSELAYAHFAYAYNALFGRHTAEFVCLPKSV